MNMRTIPITAFCAVILAACGGGGDDPVRAVGSDGQGGSTIDGTVDGDTTPDPTAETNPDPVPETNPDPAPADPAPADPAPADPPPMEPIAAKYEVTFLNLTAGQPLSPPAVLVHGPGYSLFKLGKPASSGLEHLAEGAATMPLIDGAKATGTIVSYATGSAPIGPGGQATVSVDIPMSADLSSIYLSAASMLVNTNDAITAIRGADLHAIAVGETHAVTLISYDTGTEANDEVGAHIPGPAGGGEGFNAARDDISDVVLPHPGVVTADDGLATSALSGIHRWLNPVVRVWIRRVE